MVRPEKVHALTAAALTGMETEARDASAGEVLSGMMTLALHAVQVAGSMGADPRMIRGAVETILLHCPPLDTETLQ